MPLTWKKKKKKTYKIWVVIVGGVGVSGGVFACKIRPKFFLWEFETFRWESNLSFLNYVHIPLKYSVVEAPKLTYYPLNIPFTLFFLLEMFCCFSLPTYLSVICLNTISLTRIYLHILVTFLEKMVILIKYQLLCTSYYTSHLFLCYLILKGLLPLLFPPPPSLYLKMRGLRI